MIQRVDRTTVDDLDATTAADEETSPPLESKTSNEEESMPIGRTKKGFSAMDIESSDGIAKASNVLSPYRTRMGFIIFSLILSVVVVVIVVGFVQNTGIRIDADLPDSVAALMNDDVLPCTDFYEYACGAWIKNTTLPIDRPSYERSFSGIKDANDALFRTILSEEWPLLSELYKSCMNTTILDNLGATPLQTDLAAIRSATTKDALLVVAGQLSMRSDSSFLFAASMDSDESNPTIQVLHVSQGGLTLPDRDYYVNTSRYATIDAPYRTMISKLLTQADWPNHDTKDIDSVVAFETNVARISLSKTALRDPVATYNRVVNLSATYPSMSKFFAGAHVPINSSTRVIVATPTFFTEAEKLLAATPLADLQTVVAYQYITSMAPTLGSGFRNATFDFFGKVLYGLIQPRERKQQCTDRVNNYLGELLARYYVQRAFNQDSLETIQTLVADVRATFRSRLERNRWMDDATRRAALEKLDQMTQLLGYPSKRRDYPIVLRVDDYFGNAQTLSNLSHFRAVAKMNQPVDKSEWSMNAHQVNAYYNPSFNQIVFPAGILQPPFFDATADAAMNYGAIGMVIGHEITHGFDDQGRNFDGDGRLSPWWTNATAKEFQDKASCVADEFSSMTVEGSENQLLGHVNGHLTLGETIADLGGLSVAFQAYSMHMKRAAVNGKTYTASDTLDKLFFLSFAQAWCQKSTDQALERSLDNVHPPAKQRVNGAVRNSDDFARVFNCPNAAPLNPVKKCRIW
ncbi:hypothetical protein AC1031_006900 [Aphanomyces cochlioides]|nr:hypothetical protein AC1031_006900 [Aphanomyces cochlioides]